VQKNGVTGSLEQKSSEKFAAICNLLIYLQAEALKLANMEENEILYPVGYQDFEEIRKGGFLYVDKTELTYNLVNRFKYVFLSRPRRFGKTLLTSTLHYYLSGRKDLFTGLAIEKLEKDWISISGVALRY